MDRILLAAKDYQEFKTDGMRTALSEASMTMNNHVDSVRLLLETGTQVNKSIGSLESLLTLAARGGHVNLALLLIDRDAKIEKVNDESYTPLMEAARKGHKDLVSALLSKEVPVVDEPKLPEVQEMYNEHAIVQKIVDSLVPNAKRIANFSNPRAMIRQTQLDTSNNYSSNDLQIKMETTKENNIVNENISKILTNIGVIEQKLFSMRQMEEDITKSVQELKENVRLIMVTLMTTSPPLSTSSPEVLDSSNSNYLNSESSKGDIHMVTNKIKVFKKSPNLPVLVSSDVVQTMTFSDELNIKTKYNNKPAQPSSDNYNIMGSSQVMLKANYARGVMAGVAAMKLKLKVKFNESYSGDECDKELSIQMLKFCAEQTAKRDGGLTNLKELMIHSLISEYLLKVQIKDLQNPNNMVEILFPLSKVSHDSLSHGSADLLSILGELNTQTELKDLNCIDVGVIENIASETLIIKDLSNLPNLDKKLQKEIIKHHCNPSLESGLSSTISFQLFETDVQNQTSVDFSIENVSSMDIANDVAVTQFGSEETTTEQSTTATVPMLNNCIPAQEATALQIPSESVTSNKPSPTTTLPITTNKGFSTISEESYSEEADVSQDIYIDFETQSYQNIDEDLLSACRSGREELVKLLLNKGANIEHRDKKGFTSLLVAAKRGFYETVKILLNNAAYIEAQSHQTLDTPLTLACSEGHYKICKLLLESGANKEHGNASDFTPLGLAAVGGHVDIVRLLLNNGAEINSRTGSKLGKTPLMLAATEGKIVVVKLLLEKGSDVNAYIESNHSTALTLACFQGHHEVISLLLDRKANIEHRNKTGLTPLMEAACEGFVKVGKILLDKGADVNAINFHGTALIIASSKGYVQFVELLLQKNAHLEYKNQKGHSALWLAANGGHLGVIELLLKAGANIDHQDNRKVTCLMAAFQKGHVKVVRWMVNHVCQFPNDQDMKRFIATLNDKESIKNCRNCMTAIQTTKDQQVARANKNASILLEELDMEKAKEELKKASTARRKMKKKRKIQANSGKTLEETEDNNEGQENEEEEEEVAEEPDKEMEKKVNLKKNGKYTVLNNVKLDYEKEIDSGNGAKNRESFSSRDAKNANAARVIAKTQNSSSNQKDKKKGNKVALEVKTTDTPINVQLTTKRKNAAKLNSPQIKSNKGTSVNLSSSKIDTISQIETNNSKHNSKNNQQKIKNQQLNSLTNTVCKEPAKIDNQSKEERIITIKGTTKVAKQVNDFTAMPTKDKETNMSVIAKNSKVTSALNKSVNKTKAKTVAPSSKNVIVSQSITVSASQLAIAPQEKKINTTDQPKMSYANALMSSMDLVSKPSQQLPTSEPPKIQSASAAPSVVSPKANTAPLPHQPSVNPKIVAVSEYSLFGPSKLPFPTIWGKDRMCGEQKSAVTTSFGTIGPLENNLGTDPPMADPSKAPGYGRPRLLPYLPYYPSRAALGVGGDSDYLLICTLKKHIINQSAFHQPQMIPQIGYASKSCSAFK